MGESGINTRKLTIFLSVNEPIIGSRRLEIEQQTLDPDQDLCYGDVCVPSDYNKLEPPLTVGQALDVKISVDEVRALDFDDKKFTISFSMFLSVQWTDDRIIAPRENQPFRVSSFTCS